MFTQDPIRRRMFTFLLLGTAAAAAGIQGWSATSANFAVEAAGLSADKMGLVHSLREIPGLLSFLIVYVIRLVPEHRAAGASILLLGLGVASVGFFPDFNGILATTLVLSVGFHAFEPLSQSLSLQYFSLKDAPLVLGRLRAAAQAAVLAVGLLVVALSGAASYQTIFLIQGGAVALAGILMLAVDPSDAAKPPQIKRLIFRREHRLYHLLIGLSGARRQIFTVFGTYLLVAKFDFPLVKTAALFMVGNLIGVLVNPLIGRLINQVGERRLLVWEYAFVIAVFLAYAYTDSPTLAALVFLLDHLAFHFETCIRTYLQKIADPAELAACSSAGFAVNHIAAVVLPAVGGALWKINPTIPFLVGAALSLVSLAAATRVTVGR